MNCLELARFRRVRDKIVRSLLELLAACPSLTSRRNHEHACGNKRLRPHGPACALRAWGWDDLDFVHVNETKGGPETAAHLLEFDSVHGRWNQAIGAGTGELRIGDKSLSFSEHGVPGEVPWRDLGVDVVLECSGKFRTADMLAPYFRNGVRKVIVAAPVKEGR